MAFGKLFEELKKTIILSEKTEQLGKDVSSLSSKIKDYANENKSEFKDLQGKHQILSDRLIRIETLVEFTQNNHQQPQTEQKQLSNS